MCAVLERRKLCYFTKLFVYKANFIQIIKKKKKGGYGRVTVCDIIKKKVWESGEGNNVTMGYTELYLESKQNLKKCLY